MRVYAGALRQTENDATLDIEQERSLVAIALVDYPAFLELRLGADHFASPECQQILRLAAHVHELGTPVSAASVLGAYQAQRGPGAHVAAFGGRLTDYYSRPSVPPSADLQRSNHRAHVLRGGLLQAAAQVERGEVDRAVAGAEETLQQAKALTEPTPPAAPRIVWRGTDDIFAPLPEPKWLVRELQIGPGRPAMLAGYGASAKTLSAQALALAVASGTWAWGRFATSFGTVRHLDYEMGWYATARRYQRLAIGHGVDRGRIADRLMLAVFPCVFLDSPDAVDAYATACDGADLVILDALRGAAPTQDENDSSIRRCLDNLTVVSEKTGTAFVVLHHAGKPKESHSDERTILRGSSAIFDACGCVLVVTAGKTKDAPRKISQPKVPGEAQGGHIDDFTLTVEDVAQANDPTAGVRVVYAPTEPVNPVALARDKYKRHALTILTVIRSNPGATQNVILTKCGMQRAAASLTLAALVDEGRVHVSAGARGAKIYRVSP